MHTNRFISLLVAISLLAVTVLWVRKVYATSNVDSAIYSYTAWARAAEVKTTSVDSATRSYMAQAKAVICGADNAYSPDLDSATRSYIAWGLASNVGTSCR